MRQDKFLACPFFCPFSSNIDFWPYCTKNPNFKFQFQPLYKKIGRDKNLARLIELDRMERANDKNVPHRELRRYSLLEKTFLF